MIPKKNLIFQAGLQGLFLFLLTIACGSVVAFEYSADPHVLFERMNSRDGSELHTGLFTYERGGQLTTLSIERRLEEGVVYDKVDVLDGPAWELSRRSGKISCQIEEPESAQLQLDTARLPWQIEDYYCLLYTSPSPRDS